MNRWLALGAGILVVGLGALGLWAARPTPPARPNVLILLWDTVRADRMSLYGHTRATTPFLEAVARDARVWDHAIATSEWTAPTHASLFTGLPLRAHGMDTYTRWLDDEHLTLAEHLGAAGYDTWAFTGNRFVSDHVNMLQGFGVQDHTFQGRWKGASAKATRAKLIPEDRSSEISPGWKNDGHGEGWSKKLTLFKDAAPVAHRAFGRWLDTERDPSRPFLAFVNLMEAHQPRIPSRASREALMDRDAIDLALATDSTLFRLMAYNSGKAEFTDAELEVIRATYDAALLDLDRAAEALFADLEARGLLDDTIVVLTADHGELLGEHDLFDHRWALYEPLIHVPLLVRYPRGVEPGRVGEAVSTTQVARTITDLVGVDPMPTSGPSLLGTQRPSEIISELRDPNRVMEVITRAFPDVPPGQFARSLATLLDGELKLIRASDGQHELYDLAADPSESVDLSATRPADRDRLLERLAAWERATPAWKPSARMRQGEGAVDEETREMLELLGYTADEAPNP